MLKSLTNFKFKKNKMKGISLISLIIVIIIILVITSSIVITIVTNDGGISSAYKAKFKSDFQTIKEYINAYRVTASAEPNYDKKELDYMSVEKVNEVLNIDQYKNKIGVYDEKIVLLTDKQGDFESESAKDLGYEVLNMTPEEFDYYIELGIVQEGIENKRLIGRELMTNDYYDSIQIDNITYGNGWYLIGNYTNEEKSKGTYNEHYEMLDITDTTHAPYLVNYETGEVLSIDGMVMYKAEILVHSFNENEVNNLANAIVYVDTTTKNTNQYYGSLYSTKLYTGSNYSGTIYNDNNGDLMYDENGALLLDENNSIPVLSVNQKYKIDNAYSLSVTIKGDVFQKSKEGISNTIVALSDEITKYICWLGIYDGYLHLHSFCDNVYTGNYDRSEIGFASVDISKYNNAAMNIHVTGVKGGQSKIYINGEEVKTFKSGDFDYTYKYLTIGDLRVGRNLKFAGKIYDFALYGTELTAKQVKSSYARSEKYVLSNE